MGVGESPRLHALWTARSIHGACKREGLGSTHPCKRGEPPLTWADGPPDPPTYMPYGWIWGSSGRVSDRPPAYTGGWNSRPSCCLHALWMDLEVPRAPKFMFYDFR